MRRAARVDGPQAGIVKALRAYGCLVAHTHMVGDGFPDLVIASPGKRKAVGLVEIKNGLKPPSERELTPEQIEFWDAWQGAPMALVTDIDSALKFARQLAFGLEGA